MAVDNKQIKRSKDGRIVRYVGKNVKGTAEKFPLGFEMTEAESTSASSLLSGKRTRNAPSIPIATPLSMSMSSSGATTF